MLRGPNQFGREVIAASEERLRARLGEVKFWLNIARFIAGDELQGSTKRSHAAGIIRYLLMLRISTKAALFEKLRSKREKETQENAFSLSIELHSLPSEKERERLRKESIRLFEHADRCGDKRWNDHVCYNRVANWPFDFAYIAIALKTVGMNPNDDLMPSEYQLSNLLHLKEEQTQPTLPDEVAGPGSPKDQSKLVASPEIPQHTGSMPSLLGGHSGSMGEPVVLTSTEGAPKWRGGRPTHPATLAYRELTSGKNTDPRLAEICNAFDKKKVPLPKMLSSAGSWKEALKTQTGRVQSWKNEQRRPLRPCDGKLGKR